MTDKEWGRKAWVLLAAPLCHPLVAGPALSSGGYDINCYRLPKISASRAFCT